MYLIWTHLSYFAMRKPIPSSSEGQQKHARHRYRSSSPRVETREHKKSAFNVYHARKDDFGYVWMTVPKNYRDSTDDGVLTALLLGPLISVACLYSSTRLLKDHPEMTSPLPPGWLIEEPKVLHGEVEHLSALEALVFSRRTLVQLSTFCSYVFLVHLTASRWYEARKRAKINVPEGERASVPRSEWQRTRLYITFALSVSIGALALRYAFQYFSMGLWQDLSYFDVLSASMFYQFTLYFGIRLAHHSFTLGELGFTSFGACIIFMEATHLTISRIWPVTTPYVKTFRLPTPLLIMQIALIPGSILIGFFLSPLLYLSRHIAQQPRKKLRFPEERLLHRRLLALCFYAFAALIVGGLLGMWARWCLDGRDPWIWTIRWLLAGPQPWSRPLLLSYWAVLASISVAGWGRQLSRSRRYRQRATLPGLGIPNAAEANGNSSPQISASSNLPISLNGTSNGNACTDATNENGSDILSAQPQTAPSNSNPTQTALGLNLPALSGLPTLPALANLPHGPNVSAVATDLLDAADKRMPTLTLNARRKFFHALAVVMFVPGIAYDPAFIHLSFSVAFAVFAFAEFIRYFALYPLGAVIHVFLSEFLDDKDSGTAIMSHFYLLTGCAGSVWMEGPSKLLGYTGVLTLGIGDAMASIIGRRIGRYRWSPTSAKTIEGSLAFVVSVVFCAWLLRLCGLVEPFSTSRYIAVTACSAVLEALSVQNDNLTLPWYMWALQVISDV